MRLPLAVYSTCSSDYIAITWRFDTLNRTLRKDKIVAFVCASCASFSYPFPAVMTGDNDRLTLKQVFVTQGSMSWDLLSVKQSDNCDQQDTNSIVVVVRLVTYTILSWADRQGYKRSRNVPTCQTNPVQLIAWCKTNKGQGQTKWTPNCTNILTHRANLQL